MDEILICVPSLSSISPTKLTDFSKTIKQICQPYRPKNYTAFKFSAKKGLHLLYEIKRSTFLQWHGKVLTLVFYIASGQPLSSQRCDTPQEKFFFVIPKLVANHINICWKEGLHGSFCLRCAYWKYISFLRSRETK